MIPGYTKNRNVQMVISLLQKHEIRNVVISPGTTILELTAGLQYSNKFELYSSIDERSAAYMACGIATESGEPVVIICTEATASRNYFPGITEAYYRQLPILVITGVHRYAEIGQLKPQIIDRSVSPCDTFKYKVQLPVIKDKEDEWQSMLKINQAILELKRHGNGPVHIDLPCCDGDYDFFTQELPDVRMINRYTSTDVLPGFPSGKVAVFAGSGMSFDKKLNQKIDNFCNSHDAVVFCDHTSGYKGKYRVQTALLAVQKKDYDIFNHIDLLIHIGGAVADEGTMQRMQKVKEVWRVNPDGELRDTFKKLTAVFEMEEKEFFQNYCGEKDMGDKYLAACKKNISEVCVPVEKLPFSNLYAAAVLASRLPEQSIIHLGLSNTIRAWSLFEFPPTVISRSNVGCRGIDGVLSTFIGASLVHKDKICFCILGDLTFFYDMNALGNRHIARNVRILLINNNGGGVFKLTGAPGQRFFGNDETDKFIAAAGHFGNKSDILVKNYAESLGFHYLTASTKEEFDKAISLFLTPDMTDKPIFFEIFTDDIKEREAFDIAYNIDASMAGKATQVAKQIMRERGKNFVKKIIPK